MNWGAVLQDLRLTGHDAPLVLGFDRFDYYPAHSPYMGAIAGRYANRIANGRFTIDGTTYQADKNFLGKHTLHGGSKSFGKQVWEVLLHGDDFVTFALHDPAGAMGFPGALDVTCTYRMKIPGTLSVELSATCDEPTLCNLAHHSYFNLDDGGSGDILDHRLMLAGAAYLPVDEELIPTGVVKPGRRDGFRFPAGPADQAGAGGRAGSLRSQFLPDRGARAAQAGCVGAGFLVRRGDGGLDHRARRAVLCRRQGRADRAWPWRTHVQGLCGLCAGAADLAGFAQPALFPAGGAVAGRGLSPGDGVSVQQVSLSERRAQRLEWRQRATHLHDRPQRRHGPCVSLPAGGRPARRAAK